MKDIELESVGEGVYDWKFTNNDISVVNGNQRLLSAVIHSIMLNRNELEQSIYIDKGCMAHEYVKQNATEENLEKVSSTIRASINELHGVTDSSIQVAQKDNTITISKITIQKTDGTEVVINAI